MSREMRLALTASILLHAIALWGFARPSVDLGGLQGQASEFRVVGLVRLAAAAEEPSRAVPSLAGGPTLTRPVPARPMESESMPLVNPVLAEARPVPASHRFDVPEAPSTQPRALEDSPVEDHVSSALRRPPNPHTRREILETESETAIPAVPATLPPKVEDEPEPQVADTSSAAAAAAGLSSPGRAGEAGDISAGRGTSTGPREAYLRELVRRLHAKKRYPPEARARGIEGTAEVSFLLEADGSVTDVALAKSSSHALLDEEVLALARRAAPFPPLSPALGLRRWRLTVPIRFGLESRR